MVLSEAIQERYSSICANILEPAIKNMALSFCVPLPDFYDTVHELSISPTRLMAEDAAALGVDISLEDGVGYDRTLETVKSRQKFYRILKRLLLVEDSAAKGNAELISRAKIYDKCLYTAMVSTYQTVADMIGDISFKRYNVDQVLRALTIEERKGLSFSEFATLTCLYMALNRSSVEVLNTPIVKDGQKKRLRGRFRKIKQWLYSEELYDSLVAEMIDLLAEAKEEQYGKLLEWHCRQYWLPENKRCLKYFDYAMETHGPKKNQFSVPKITVKGQPLFGMLEITENGKSKQIPMLRTHMMKISEDTASGAVIDKDVANALHRFNIEYDEIKLYQEFFFVILPVAQMITQGIVPPNLIAEKCLNGDNEEICIQKYLLQSEKLNPITKEYVKRKTDEDYSMSAEHYCLAVQVSEVLDRYIRSVIGSILTFLECLPETKICGDTSLAAYLSEL